MARLETVRVSRASADQRRGRAGRTAPGTCYRLWSEDENASLQPFAPPEILDGDLAPLALDLAAAGVSAPDDLAWLDQPPAAAYAQARELLTQLEAIDVDGRITPHGTAMTRFGVHPRLSHMIIQASPEGTGVLACELAALLGERDPLRVVADVVGADVQSRIEAVRKPQDFPSADRHTLRRIEQQASRFHAHLKSKEVSADASATGRVLARAFPDRVAQRRPGPLPRFLLRNGTGAHLPEGDPLTREAFIVVAESDGRVPEARIWLAAPLNPGDIGEVFSEQIVEVESVEWDDTRGITAVRERRFGALVLSQYVVAEPDPSLVAQTVSDLVRRRGLDILPWNEHATRLRQRIAFLHAFDPSWPDVADSVLVTSLLERLSVALERVRSARGLRSLDVAGALLELLDWDQRRRVDQLAPTHFVAPTGSRVPIDYGDPRAPSVSIRLQELFGTSDTPTILAGRVALTLQLLSPAHRPVQVTRDLAGFWQSSYFEVRKSLRARYPKHAWPDDPLSAPPTRKARRRDQ
jgi:ATP-dependent helicase HrpB